MRQMIFLLILLGGTVGCKEDNNLLTEPQFVGFGEEFQIETNEHFVITSNEFGEVTDSLSVEMISIDDTRCPKGVQCPIAGNVGIAIRTSNSTTSQDISMCIGCVRMNRIITEVDTAQFMLNDNQYMLLFKDALPYPSVDNNINRANKAILKVIR